MNIDALKEALIKSLLFYCARHAGMFIAGIHLADNATHILHSIQT